MHVLLIWLISTTIRSSLIENNLYEKWWLLVDFATTQRFSENYYYYTALTSFLVRFKEFQCQTCAVAIIVLTQIIIPISVKNILKNELQNSLVSRTRLIEWKSVGMGLNGFDEKTLLSTPHTMAGSISVLNWVLFSLFAPIFVFFVFFLFPTLSAVVF